MSDRLPDPQKERKFEGRAPGQNMQLQIAGKSSDLCCHLANANEESNSVFYQITFDFVTST